MQKNTTLADIAQEVGLSVSSVSSALTGHSGNTVVSAATIQRVQEVAARMNYHPHAAARSMRRKRHQNIGYFLVRDAADSYFTPLVEAGITDTAGIHDYSVVLMSLPTRLSEATGQVPRAFRENHLDALIVADIWGVDQNVLGKLDKLGLPIVHLNTRHEQNAVYIDDFQGSYQMARHLLNCGHSRIAYFHLKSSYHHYSQADRLGGYSKAMEEVGRPTVVVEANYHTIENQLEALCCGSDAPDAVLCYDDWCALRLQHFAYKKHISIPETLAITGYNDEFVASLCPVPLTTVTVPWYEMGVAAVDMALSLVGNSDCKKKESIILQTELNLRFSTKPNQTK